MISFKEFLEAWMPAEVQNRDTPHRAAIKRGDKDANSDHYAKSEYSVSGNKNDKIELHHHLADPLSKDHKISSSWFNASHPDAQKETLSKLKSHFKTHGVGDWSAVNDRNHPHHKDVSIKYLNLHQDVMDAVDKGLTKKVSNVRPQTPRN